MHLNLNVIQTISLFQVQHGCVQHSDPHIYNNNRHTIIITYASQTHVSPKSARGSPPVVLPKCAKCAHGRHESCHEGAQQSFENGTPILQAEQTLQYCHK